MKNLINGGFTKEGV